MTTPRGTRARICGMRRRSHDGGLRVSLGKNFRLPIDVKPVRYSAHLAPDLKAGTFEGRMELEVQLEKPRRQIYLHAVGLEISRARARGAAKATAKLEAESET